MFSASLSGNQRTKIPDQDAYGKEKHLGMPPSVRQIEIQCTFRSLKKRPCTVCVGWVEDVACHSWCEKGHWSKVPNKMNLSAGESSHLHYISPHLKHHAMQGPVFWAIYLPPQVLNMHTVPHSSSWCAHTTVFLPSCPSQQVYTPHTSLRVFLCVGTKLARFYSCHPFLDSWMAK